MKCLETRRTPEGFKRRRYLREDGARVTTLEVPLEVWRAINRQGRGQDRAAAVVRAQAREALRRQALKHLADDWKAVASAHELGVPLRTIQRWRSAA